MNSCPECNTVLIEDAEFCHKCGSKVNHIKSNSDRTDVNTISKSEIEYGILRCPQCGLINPPKSTTCDCGYPLSATNENSPDNTIYDPIGRGKNSIRKKPKVLIFFGYLFSVLGGYLGIVIALYLLLSKKKYDSKSRRHGILMIIISLIAAIIFEGIRQSNY